MNFNKIEFYTSYGFTAQLPKDKTPEVVFSGRSNVGKSSLINKVTNRKHLAKVSATPGKTVTINFFKGDTGFIVDLPGYGFARVAKSEKERWALLMEKYFNTDRDIRLVIQLVDIRHKPSADDIQMINYLIDGEFPFIIALTKADKLSKTQLAKRLEELKAEIPYGDEILLLPTSSENGMGIEQLREIISDVLEPEEEDEE